MKTLEKFDICIVGGGLCGLMTSIVLNKIGFKIAIIDNYKITKNSENSPYDGRSTALAYGILNLFKMIGLKEQLIKASFPINKITVCEYDKQLSNNHLIFDSSLLDEKTKTLDKTLGRMVLNADLKNILKKKLLSTNIKIFDNHKVIDLPASKNSQSLGLLIEHNQKTKAIYADLILAADGKFSTLTRITQGKKTIIDYPQTALTFTITHKLKHKSIAYEIFTPIGSLALLPLSQNRFSVVWSLKHDIAKIWSSDQKLLLQRLNEIIIPICGKAKIDGKIYSFPLSANIKEDLFYKNILFIGDAAHGVHPIAGQGFNLALKDIAVLYEELQTIKQTGGDLSNCNLQTNFKQARNFDNINTCLMADFFNNIFLTQTSSIRTTRKLAFSLLSKQKWFLKLAMKSAGSALGKRPLILQNLK